MPRRTRHDAPAAAERAAADPSGDLPNIPLLHDELTHGQVELKPTWRGWIHAVTFPLAIAAGVVLIVLADGGPAKAASAIFMASSLLLFGVSATYHRFNWSPRVKAIFRRIDHSNIFLLIAGTYTPLAVCALPVDKATLLLAMVWGGALLGIGFRIFWLSAPRWLYVALYILLGWAAMLYIVDLFQANVATMVLVVAGGLSYTVGAVFYGLKRPNPVPGVFGFHEIFHSCTVIAFLAQWTGILLIALDPVAV
ncbi:PAQR family membrane homeostasis protein TrhA [Homoserinibacter sp. YIM 151385]|uniref:PAQR family membrane homeostasis protein TrhA n=1 Tax=Homoserinibacter sp. YIM 151385 TaxID=2985506 RepID=UPI0022F0BB08|nr:hemolysin III family protein [Homoserinibacter sp. YIM 151385]WBU38065.1 hemolysin III family protein [Homoserinibacter sp. YIM 151385]